MVVLLHSRVLHMVPQTSMLHVRSSQQPSVKLPAAEVVWVEDATWMEGLHPSHVLTNTQRDVRPKVSHVTLDANFQLRSLGLTPRLCK